MRNKYVLILFSLSVYFNFFSLTPVLQAQCVPASLIKVTVPVPLPACNPGDCTDLLAVYNIPKQTNDYAVSTIGYCPSFPFTGGTVINATGDDVWSSTVNLPFSVCFYGVNYNRVLVGTNGVVTFDLAGQTPGGYCNWPFTATIPNPGFAIRNAIYGVYQDTDIRIPPVTNYAIQNVNYYVLDTGVNAAPNRVFVANFNELPQYSCGTAVGFQTSQIVIHETTNIIDIVVSKRTSCTGWNSGSGLIGVQNQAGTLARVPPGRNTGTWSATNEAWRFTPIGPNTTVSLAWLENGTPIGTTNPINVCPSATGPNLYTAVVTYTRCDGSTVSVQDDIIVDIAPPLPLNNPHDIIICTPNPPPYTVDINENADILLGVPNPADYLIKYYEDQNDAINDTPTNINLISDAPLATFLVPVVPKTIYVRLEDFVTTGCFNVRSFIIDATASPSGTFLYPATPYCNSITTPQPITPTALTSGGTYSSMPAGLILNASTGAVTPSGSTVGTYLVTYNIVASANCPAYSTTANVEIKICTCTVVASSAAETLCVNTALNPITYTVAGGAVSASVTAGTLPPGISGSFSGGVYTLSGIPTSSGVYNFTVSVDSSTDVCTAATTITVNPNVTITLSSAATTANQTVCINAAITSITYSITNGGTGANIVGLPTGVSGSYLGGVFTITGIPTQSGTFNYLITTSGGCSTASLGGTITVNPNATIVLTSAPATANQTLCINTAIANIIYTIGSGGTGAAVIGLPTGISGSYSGGLFTMTGIPTQSGTFNYAVTTSGGCSTASLGGTITVNPNVTIALSSAPSTTSQILCINTAIAPITYAITNAGILGGAVSGLPTGVSGSYSGGVFTISGSPTQSGTFNYLITTSGGCSTASLGGTITINPNATIVLTSAPATANQTLCINTAMVLTRYTIGNGATGATITSSLPSGVSGSFAAGVFTISGTPSSSGTFNYVVTTSGGCSADSSNGSIIVKPDVTILITSAATTAFQTVCRNTAIVPITYAIGNGGTGATVSGLPAGFSGNFAGGIFTISGSASTVGIFNFTVTTTGGCSSAFLSGSVEINPNASISLTSGGPTTSQNVCVFDPIAAITYAVGNGALGASITSGNLPAGLQGTFSAGIFTIIGTATTSGTFNYTVTTSGGCFSASLSGTIKVNPLPIVVLPQNGFICVDETGVALPGSSYVLNTNLSTTMYAFVWSDASGTILGANGSSYEALTPGLYSVKVTHKTTNCYASGSATVVPSLPPAAAFASASSYFSESQVVTVTVTPPGIYEYQLDNGAFQDNNQFINLTSGTHEIVVRDKFGCGFVKTTIRIIDYPKFFTPNSDGYNDTWNIKDLSDQPNSKIYIFDRYGKLLKEISPIGTGWDGTLNANELPATDYWFKVYFDELGVPKVFKSHFALKR